MWITPLKIRLWGAWVAQSVKYPTLDFGSGDDLTVHEFESHVELWADSMEPAWDFLTPSLSLSLFCSCSLSNISKNKTIKNLAVKERRKRNDS